MVKSKRDKYNLGKKCDANGYICPLLTQLWIINNLLCTMPVHMLVFKLKYCIEKYIVIFLFQCTHIQINSVKWHSKWILRIHTSMISQTLPTFPIKIQIHFRPMRCVSFDITNTENWFARCEVCKCSVVFLCCLCLQSENPLCDITVLSFLCLHCARLSARKGMIHLQ